MLLFHSFLFHSVPFHSIRVVRDYGLLDIHKQNGELLQARGGAWTPLFVFQLWTPPDSPVASSMCTHHTHTLPSSSLSLAPHTCTHTYTCMHTHTHMHAHTHTHMHARTHTTWCRKVKMMSRPFLRFMSPTNAGKYLESHYSQSQTTSLQHQQPRVSPSVSVMCVFVRCAVEEKLSSEIKKLKQYRENGISTFMGVCTCVHVRVGGRGRQLMMWCCG